MLPLPSAGRFGNVDHRSRFVNPDKEIPFSENRDHPVGYERSFRSPDNPFDVCHKKCEGHNPLFYMQERNLFFQGPGNPPLWEAGVRIIGSIHLRFRAEGQSRWNFFK
jgi:hypothetical protein